MWLLVSKRIDEENRHRWIINENSISKIKKWNRGFYEDNDFFDICLNSDEVIEKVEIKRIENLNKDLLKLVY